MYSNCFIEALRAKLKDPKNIKMFRIPKEVSDTKHWMWFDSSRECYCHFSANKPRWYNHWFHKGKFVSRQEKVFNKFAVSHLKGVSLERKKEIGEKLALKSLTYFSENWISVEGNLEKVLPAYKISFLESTFKKKVLLKISFGGMLSILDYETFKSTYEKVKNKSVKIKVISPLDGDFYEYTTLNTFGTEITWDYMNGRTESMYRIPDIPYED